MSRLIKATIAAPRPGAPRPTLASLKPQRRAVTERALAASLYSDLLGKPYLAGARGPASYDCVGLALEIARRAGKTLPAFLSSEAELHAQLGAGGATLADLPQAPRPAAGCIVLLRMSSAEHHIGLMIDEYRMIHTLERVGCVMERVNSPLWQRKVIGYYTL